MKEGSIGCLAEISYRRRAAEHRRVVALQPHADEGGHRCLVGSTKVSKKGLWATAYEPRGYAGRRQLRRSLGP
jgi:hypothetical protein